MIKKIANRLFKWFCNPDYYDEIHGDLEELYHKNIDSSVKAPQWRYFFQVFGLFRPSLIRPLSNIQLTSTGMFKNYFKIGTRNLLRQKLFTTINILGLAIGLSSFLLISEYIRFEQSYDAFYKDSENIYRLSTVQVINGQVGVKDAMSYHPAARTVRDEIPGVKATTVTYKFGDLITRQGESVIKEEQVISADSNFFDVFSHRVISGSPDDMLKGPDKIVLTESKARFYFDDEDPIGKNLELLGSFNRTFQITGVIKDIPQNTHYKYDMIISDESIKDRGDYDNWNAFNFYSYVLFEDGYAPAQFEDQFEAIILKYQGENTNQRFAFSPIEELHLTSDFTFEAEIPGNEKAVTFLIIISFFILIIAWVNYINLSTAKAIDRAKEVGLRKVIGAYKSQLVSQFLLEALIINVLAALLALLIAQIAIPSFNELVGKDILSNVWSNFNLLQNLLVFFFIGAIISGFYPAIVLSGFKPITVLKGKYRNSKGGVILRKGLVVAQFAASIILIASTFTVYQQLQFMKGKDLGISTDYVVGLELPEVSGDQQDSHNETIKSFKETLRNFSAIETVGGTDNLPGGGSSDVSSTTGKVRIVGITDRVEGTTYLQFNDEDLLEALDLELLAGRNFDRNRVEDSLVVMVNESFFKKFNVSDIEDMVLEKIQFGSDENNRKFEIIGIIRDFNRTSLKSDIEPTIYIPNYNARSLVIELNPNNYREAISYISETWKVYFPDSPVNYSFLDDRFAALYQQDQRFGQIFGVFSILAIFIATLGLFGLSSFMAIQKTVEVGVRKVLGASIPSIIGLFFREFLILLAVAGVISLPLVYYGMSSWLGNYAFRIDFPWIACVLALGLVIIFALFTVGYQIYRIAILDPVKTLKYE